MDDREQRGSGLYLDLPNPVRDVYSTLLGQKALKNI